MWHDILKPTLKQIRKVLIKSLFLFCKMKDVILIESFNDFDMNGGTLFEYLIRHEYNKKYRIVWFVKGNTVRELPNNVIAVPLKGFSLRREYYNNIAKYMFYDNCPIYKYREGQIVTYLGHATRAMKNCRGLVSQPQDIDYVISSSEHNNELMSEVYNCDINKMIVTGMPVTDLLFHKWEKQLKVPNADRTYKKTIFWTPTFRALKGDKSRNDSAVTSETGLALFTTFELYEQLQKVLHEARIHLVIKFHPGQVMSDIKVSGTENITLLSPKEIREQGVDTYKLLTQADALISDYSSISFDFLLLDRPIAYVLSDYEEYKLGFAVDNPQEYMPGDYIYTVDEMYKFIEAVGRGVDTHREKRNELKDKIHKYQDGKSCERLVEFLRL